MKRPLLLIVLVFLSASNTLFSQDTDVKLRELFLDGEYFFLSEDYEEALYSYNTLYKRGYADNANINYRIGQCYLNIPGEKNKSISYLEKATQDMVAKYSEGSFKETRAPYDAQFYLGNAYRITNQLDKAIAAYEKYKTLVDPKNTSAIKLANNEIESCNYAREMMKNTMVIKKVSLGRPVNTANRDYFPAVSGDESVLVYNSAQKFYQAIFFSKKVNKKWTNPINITPEVESDGNQYVSSLSFDGTELYLREEDKFQADLLVSKYENGKWSKSKPLNKNINTKYWEGNACVTLNGQILYFSSNRPGGAGALDIYKSEKQVNGEWGPAINLGSSINTEYNEDAPFITEDGKRLYFASQGHNTMGGYDVFYSEYNIDGTWSKPVNLGYSINTTDDELFYFPVKNGKIAYISGYLKEGYGSQDLFRLELAPTEDMATVQDTIKKEPKVEAIAQVTDSLQKIKERELSPEVVKSITESKVSEQKAEENVVSRSIFFDFNSAVLEIGAKKLLDHLCIVMKNIPELKVEFIGTTDAKGSEVYNLKLSEKRAKAAKDYVVSKGINANRITIKGVGESSFIAINSNPDGSDNPEGRKFNRRVDTQIKGINIKVEEVKLPDNLKTK
jgi:outer membrane protein OmpA-like peptidoglycan-associated protein